MRGTGLTHTVRRWMVLLHCRLRLRAFAGAPQVLRSVVMELLGQYAAYPPEERDLPARQWWRAYRDHQSAYRELKSLGRCVIPILTDLYRDGGSGERFAAVRALPIYGALPSVVKTLLHALADEDTAVRLAALNVTWLHKEKETVTAILPLLNDPDRTIRGRAINALGMDLGALEAVEPLLELLENCDPLMRQNAASSLGYIGDRRALPALRRHLRDKDRGVRKAVQSALVSFDLKRWEEENRGGRQGSLR